MRCLLATILLVCVVASVNADPPWQPIIVQYEPGTELAALAQLQQRGYRLLRRVPAINTLYARLPPATESQVRQTVAAAIEDQAVAVAAAATATPPDLPTGTDDASDAGRNSATAAGSRDLEQLAAAVTQATAPFVAAAAQELEKLPVISKVTADPLRFLHSSDLPAAPVTRAVNPSSEAPSAVPTAEINTGSSSNGNTFTCPPQQWEDTLTPEDNEFIPWGVKAVQALDPTVLSISAAMQETGDITVCVIDSGIDQGSAVADLPAGISGCDDQSNPLCYFAWNVSYGDIHGTHVMGTVAAVRGNGRGVVGVAGDSPRVRHVSVFGPNFEAYDSTIIMAMDWCIQVMEGAGGSGGTGGGGPRGVAPRGGGGGRGVAPRGGVGGRGVAPRGM